MLNKRPRTFHALPDRQSVSPSRNLRTQQTINDGMALLNRSHVLTRLQLTYRLLPWSRTLDQNWPQATTLWPPFSTTCFQAVSTQYSITVANARIPAPNFLLGREARYLMVPRPYHPRIQVGRFSSTPSPAQAKRSRQSKNSRGPPKVPRSLSPPLKEHIDPRRMPAAATYPPGPVGVRRPTVQTPPASNEHLSPRAKSTRSAVRYIICIQFAIFYAWQYSGRHQICMYEGCDDMKIADTIYVNKCNGCSIIRPYLESIYQPAATGLW